MHGVRLRCTYWGMGGFETGGWYLVAGIWYLVAGVWLRVTGCWCLGCRKRIESTDYFMKLKS